MFMTTPVRRGFSVMLVVWLSTVVIGLVGESPDVKPLDSLRVQRVTAPAKMEIPLVTGMSHGISEMDSGSMRYSANVSINPEFKGIPREWVVSWVPGDADLNAEGTHLKYRSRFYRHPSRNRYRTSEEDVTAMLGQMPEGSWLMPTDHVNYSSERGFGTHYQFENRDLLKEKECRLVVSADAHFFEWVEVGTAALRKGESFASEYGEWEIKELRGFEVRPVGAGWRDQVDLIVEYRGPVLMGSRDQETMSWNNWPNS